MESVSWTSLPLGSELRLDHLPCNRSMRSIDSHFAHIFSRRSCSYPPFLERVSFVTSSSISSTNPWSNQEDSQVSPTMTNKPLISCQSCSGKALVFFALLILPLVVTALQQQTQRNLPVAVVVPGFLTGSSDFNGLCTHLANECGIRAVPVFMPAWHWIPCLGGRSVRPILERIDFTVQHLIANQGDISKIPPYEYTLKDFWDDFWTNPGGIFRVGGSDEVEEYPVVQPHGRFNLPATLPENVKIGLVGHSAGGWISRVYLSDRSYGGKAYHGSRFYIPS